jgi:23S rRNA pseudouridine955/2504/2580 synthase
MDTQPNQYIIVNEDIVGSRLDRVLHKKFPFLSQSVIEKSLRSKFITVNEKKSTSNYRLNLGDYIRISIKLLDNRSYFFNKKQIGNEQVDLLLNSIIYRDGNLIVFNKPAGLAVQGGSKITTSLDDIMPILLEKLGIWFEEGPIHKLVHRLDKETSGILIVALNNKTARELAFYFHEHKIKKKYIAIIAGRVGVSNGRIESIIAQDGQKISENNAITDYKLLAKCSNLSLVEFMPVTGKKHQLRLHSLDLGFPILGDSKYGDFTRNESKLNLYLHASEIQIPYQGSALKLKADLPDYFTQTIRNHFKGRVLEHLLDT